MRTQGSPGPRGEMGPVGKWVRGPPGVNGPRGMPGQMGPPGKVTPPTPRALFADVHEERFPVFANTATGSERRSLTLLQVPNADLAQR